MAANFWTSTHYKQLLDPEEVDVVHPLDREKGITLDDFKLIKLHITNYVQKLAQNVKVRQRVVATAVTYMRRVYTRRSMAEYDPRLVAPTCLYLAAKAEESTVQARLLVFYIKKLYNDERYRFEIKDILEMEMKVLEALNYYLVVFHPYRPLSQFLQDAGMNDISMTQVTWGLLNDTYKMDLILMHPPHLIALACIYIASVHKDKDTTAWFEELHVDMNVVKNISMEILDFYESHRMITDERVNTAFSKLREDPAWKELVGTPVVVKWLMTFHNSSLSMKLNGYSRGSANNLSSRAEENCKKENICTELNLSFWSQCEHHLLPFSGIVHMGKYSVEGLSSVERSILGREQCQRRVYLEYLFAMTRLSIWSEHHSVLISSYCNHEMVCYCI